MEYKGSSRLHTPHDLGTGTPHTRLLSHALGGQHRYCREHDGSHIHVLGTCVNRASYDPTAQRRAAAESFRESFGPLRPSHTRTHTHTQYWYPALWKDSMGKMRLHRLLTEEGASAAHIYECLGCPLVSVPRLPNMRRRMKRERERERDRGFHIYVFTSFTSHAHL